MKLVITDHRFPEIRQEQLAVDQSGGKLVVAQTTDEQQLVDACREADGILNARAQIARAQITRTLIAAMERCRVIVRYGMGVDTIDIAVATEKGIMVANVPDYCVDEVSDHALTLLLMMSRQMNASVSLVTEDRWNIAQIPKLHRLRGKTCGLLGCGKIGSLLAAKASALGMRIAICDPFMSEELAREMGAELLSFNLLLDRSDFISLHAPLNEKTRKMFEIDAFAKTMNTASLINTVRGDLIDEAALIYALDSGKMASAGLDVIESETEVTPIRRLIATHPKVILTPHNAWLSHESRATLQARAIEQVLVSLKGEVPHGVVNR